MTDERDPDADDWFARQFEPDPPAPVPPAPRQPVPPPAAPQAPPANAGGFSWGLTPGGGEPAPPAPFVPVPPPPFIPRPAAIEPEPAFPPQPVPPPYAAPPAYTPPTADALPPVPVPPPALPADTVAYVPPAFTPPPTEAFTAFPPLDPGLDGVTEALAPQPVGLPDPVDEGLEPSAIDSLFGEQQFVEYAPPPLFGAPPPAAAPAAGPGQELVVVPVAPRPPRAPLPRLQKVLLWVAGGLLAALALVALFLVGTRIAPLFPAAVVAASPSPTPSASASAFPVIGPVAPGLYHWDRLLGGECLEPFDSAWQDQYTVVPCDQPHGGQLVLRGVFGDETLAPYPGLEELQQRMAPLCTPPTIIDYSVAGTVLDLQGTASYAADAAEWDDGHRQYFCFVDRASGEPLTASVAVPPAVPAPAP